MFHANGWCFTWAITAAAGTHVCLRKVGAAAIYHAIADIWWTIVQLPTVMGGSSMQVRMSDAHYRAVCASFDGSGSPPPATVLEAAAILGFEVDHVYGITEVSGIRLSAALGSRNGMNSTRRNVGDFLKRDRVFRAATLEGLRVVDAKTMRPVPRDGTSAR